MPPLLRPAPPKGPPQRRDAPRDVLSQRPYLRERVFARAADSSSLKRGASLGPGFVQALEDEQVFGEAGFQADEGFGAGKLPFPRLGVRKGDVVAIRESEKPEAGETGPSGPVYVPEGC